jgi:hypothetical protein
MICNNGKTSKFDDRKILGIARKGKSKPKTKGNSAKKVKKITIEFEFDSMHFYSIQVVSNHSIFPMEFNF